jgi:membrane protease YdiL (CAAX protease family)
MADVGTDQIVCNHCQKPLPLQAAFCPACGYSRDGSIGRPATAETSVRSTNATQQQRALLTVVWLFGLLLTLSFVHGIVDHFVKSPSPEAIASAVSAVIVLVFAAMQYRSVVPLLGPPKLTFLKILELAGIALISAFVVLKYFALIGHFGVPMINASTGFREFGWGIGPMVFFVSIMPGIFEELAFRGVIQSSLEKVFNSREALIIQAALFSVLHLLPLNFPSHFLMGLCFGYARLRSRSLYPGMLMHASWNAYVLLHELNRI